MELKFAKFGKDYSFVGAYTESLDEQTVLGATKALASHLGIAEASVGYLLQYGFAQSMQDCIAGAAKAVAEDLAEEAKKKGLAEPSNDEIKTATEANVAGLLGKRWDALISGDMGNRAPQQRDPILALAREEVWNALRRPENAAAAKAIRAMEKESKSAKITQLATDHKAKHLARLEAEVKRRLEAGAGQVEIPI